MFGRALSTEEIVELREEQLRRDALAKKRRLPEPRRQRVVTQRPKKPPVNPRGMMHEFLHQMKPITRKK
jgi:hypothetical protein